MLIRQAHTNDDAYTIIELIYNTDPYIYPVLMTGNLEDYKYMLLEQGMYNYKNITLAIVDGEIAGLALSFTKDAMLIANCHEALQNYYKSLQRSLDDQTEYINNVSVFEKFRGMGIGTKLIAFIEKNTRMSKVALDCLVENKKALHLYERLGYTVTGLYPTFCLDASKNIKDARMEKIILDTAK